MLDYTDLKNQIEFNIAKDDEDRLAYLTHYLQNLGDNSVKYFEEKALKAFTRYSQNGVLLENIKDVKYDIPFLPPKKPIFRFIDLFAGIGGFRIALQNLGGKCVFSSEIDNSAKKTYERNFGEVPFGDIKRFTDSEVTDEEIDKLIPDHDILAGGFPCQPFSNAGVSARNALGKAHGFNDLDQGNLFFDIVRIAQVKRPKILFLENVKNFMSHDNGKTFETVKKIIKKELGYKFFPAKLNSNTLVPQNRERVFMICLKDDVSDFKFPDLAGEPLVLGSILQDNVDDLFTISDRLWRGHINRTRRNIDRGTGFTAFEANLNKPSNTIVSRYGKDGKECLIPQRDKNPRKLTPRECARLMGFPEKYILPDSNAAAYRQFGNAVVTTLVERIAKEFLTYLR